MTNRTDKKNDFLAEAKYIADEIIQLSITEEDGISWLVRDHKEIASKNINIYNGSSGILFFILELYKATGEQKYLDVTIDGLKWLMSYNYSNDTNLAFYCGNGGVIFMLLETYKITGNEDYKEFALKLVREATPNNNSDILYGSAGSVLTLLHVYNEVNEDWLLEEIRRRTLILINDCVIYEKGVAWERNGSSIRPLCGFAHGASGIAFVFLELYRMFGNNVFYRMAELAFEYEDNYFEKHEKFPNSGNNWPDFRKDTYTPENFQKLIDAYHRKNYNEFVSYSFMSAWCHGAPGIGLARLHAYNITLKAKHLNALNCAINNTTRTMNLSARNYTFCHGALGNAALLQETDITTRGHKYTEVIEREALNALNDKARFGYYISGISKVGSAADCDLFNGKAGIGHFFLRMACPEKTSSIVMPSIGNIKKHAGKLPSFDDTFLHNLFYRKLFPNTSLLADNISFENDAAAAITRSKILRAVEDVAAHVTDKMLARAYALDLMKIELTDEVDSVSYIYVREYTEGNKFNNYPYDKNAITDIFKLQLSLNPSINILKQEGDTYTEYTLLRQTYNDESIEQIAISEFTYNLLKSFETASTVETSYKHTIKQYYTSEQSALNFRDNYKDLLKVCLAKGVLFMN